MCSTPCRGYAKVKIPTLKGHSGGTEVLRVGETVIRQDRGPTGTPGVLVIWIPSEALVKFAVFTQLLPVEPDSEPRGPRHWQASVFILHQPAFDDVVCEVMIVRVSG